MSYLAELNGGERGRDGNPLGDEIAGDFQVDGLLQVLAGKNGAVDHTRSILEVANDEGLSSDGLKAHGALIELGLAQSMVEKVAIGGIVSIRATGNAEHGEVVGIGTSDSVNDRKTSDHVCDNNDAESASRTGVAIGSVAFFNVELLSPTKLPITKVNNTKASLPALSSLQQPISFR